MGSLHPMLGTVVGIMPQLSTVEATIMLIWGGVSHWFTWGIAWVILLLVRSVRYLLVEALGLLNGTLKWVILLIISALSLRAKLRILWCIIAGMCVAARFPLGLELALLLTYFLMLAF
jgi:hypothetical protein